MKPESMPLSGGSYRRVNGELIREDAAPAPASKPAPQPEPAPAPEPDESPDPATPRRRNRLFRSE